MTSLYIERAVEAAQKAHTETPYDPGHDLLHHELVWTNCQMIVKGEQLEDQIDQDLLHTAAMWHDWERDQEPVKTRAILQDLEVPAHFIEKIISLIGEHSFEDSQITLEGQILYDADKLEYLSLPRYNAVIEATRSGRMSWGILAKYQKLLGERINTVKDQLHFESAKKEFERRLKEIAEAAKTDVELQKFISAAIQD
jgi:HD superfamily phosphohydrolase YqeK